MINHYEYAGSARPRARPAYVERQQILGGNAQCLLRLGAPVTSRTRTSNPPSPRAARNRPPHSEPGCRVAARACLPAAGLASHFRLENTMIASKHTHVRSATWRALRHAATRCGTCTASKP